MGELCTRLGPKKRVSETRHRCLIRGHNPRGCLYSRPSEQTTERNQQNPRWYFCTAQARGCSRGYREPRLPPHKENTVGSLYGRIEVDADDFSAAGDSS